MDFQHFEGDGLARFVTFCTAKRLPILTNSPNRMAVIDAIASARCRLGFRLLGFVLMPEHIHIVMIPPPEIGVGRIVAEIKQKSAIAIINILKANYSPLLDKLQIIRNGQQKYALWLRRCYDHNCRTTEAVWEKVRYCHNNPVKRGLVRDPAAWEWSSYRWYQGILGSLLEIDSPD